jgi:hypothetical protein
MANLIPTLPKNLNLNRTKSLSNLNHVTGYTIEQCIMDLVRITHVNYIGYNLKPKLEIYVLAANCN